MAYGSKLLLCTPIQLGNQTESLVSVIGRLLPLPLELFVSASLYDWEMLSIIKLQDNSWEEMRIQYVAHVGGENLKFYTDSAAPDQT